MKTQEAINEFGGVRKLADALGIWPQAIYKWGEDVPELRRYQIEALRQKRA
jgi:hypothetical protein